MNNSVKALLVISFNGEYQGLLERHVPLGWGELGTRVERNRVSPKERIFFQTEKKKCEEAPQNLLSFLLFEWGLKGCNEQKCQGNKKKRFFSMLHIPLAESWSTRGISHQPG